MRKINNEETTKKLKEKFEDENLYITVKTWEVNGVKYHADVPGRYKNMEIPIPFYRIGDIVLITTDFRPMDGLKYDYPIKFEYRQVHNEKVLIPIPKPQKPTPHFIYSDELEEEEKPQYKEGITTKIDSFNPEFTVQIKLYPNNWGTPRKLMVLDHYEQVEIPKILTLEEWRNQFWDFDTFYNKCSDVEKALLTSKTVKELFDILINHFETQDNFYSHWFYQILFYLPSVEYEQKPVYVEDKEAVSSPLKGVDIDVEVVGEEYTYKTKITSGSTIKKCGIVRSKPVDVDGYYIFSLPVMPFIYDWFNVKFKDMEVK